jgi:glycosyltransferase involved in cell wall biosynthesis
VLADGNSIHTENWLRGLAESGAIELRLVTMNPAGVRPGIPDIAAVRSIDECYAGPVNAAGGNWRYLLNLPKVMRIVRRSRPHAVVAIYLSSYGLIGALVKGRAALVHVVIGSDVMIAPARSRLYRLLARRTLARGDMFVSSSRSMTMRLSTLATVASKAVLTQQYGLEDWVIDHPTTPKTYGFVSNRAWVANSRISTLLGIFGRLGSRANLALIGAGGPLDADIRRQAAADPRVETLGLLSHRANIDVVSRSAFYFSMTASDGASLSLMEAMALGAIPVVSDIEPNREWVEQDVNGVLVPLDDEEAGVARIEHLLAQPPELLETMRARNRAIIRERGSLTKNMATFRARLSEILAGRSGVAS